MWGRIAYRPAFSTRVARLGGRASRARWPSPHSDVRHSTDAFIDLGSAADEQSILPVWVINQIFTPVSADRADLVADAATSRVGAGARPAQLASNGYQRTSMSRLLHRWTAKGWCWMGGKS
jgi:hypothetical protein